MKRILLLGFMLHMIIVVCGQDEKVRNEKIKVRIVLAGKVTDALTGDILPGATVYFSDARLGAIADNFGSYALRNVPGGHHLVEVSHAGYNSIVEHIDIEGDSVMNFALIPSIVENAGVTVTGVSTATSIRKTPVPVTAIKRDELLRSSSTNIIDVLSHEPGVTQLSTGPAISKPVIRGLGYNRVVVINEGVRQEGQQWGDEHGIEVDELSVNRVEILKGPASLIYGSDALAGVINLITNVPQAEGVVKGNLLTNYQTNNRLWSIYGNVTGNKNGIGWNVYGSYKSAGDYRNEYDGRVLNSRFNEKNFGGFLGVNRSWGFSHLIFSRFNQETGLVEGDRDDNTGDFILYGGSTLERVATGSDYDSKDPLIPFQRIQHNKLVSDNSFAIGKSRLKLNIGLQQNLRKEYGDPENASVEELFFDLRTLSYNLQWVLPEMGHWNTTIGFNGMKQGNSNRGEEVIIPEYDLFDIGVFGYAQRSFSKVTLSGGARYDNRKIDSHEFMEGSELKFEAFDKSFSNFSASIGASYEPAEFLRMKLNFARGFRAPNMAELGSNGVHEGTNRYEYGEQDLEAEKSFQVDGGIEVDYEHFSLNLDVFYNRMNNFIFYEKLESVNGGDSLVNVDGEDVMAFHFDQQHAKLSGLELSFDFHPHPLDWLHFENTVSFVRGRFDNKVDGTDNLPLIPAPRWISELRGNFTKVGKGLKNVYMKVEADKTFDQNRPFYGFNTETSTLGYTLLNAGIGADIVSNNRILMGVHFSAMNITDKAYQNHLSRLKYTDINNVSGRAGVYNMGRNFSIKVNVPLEL